MTKEDIQKIIVTTKKPFILSKTESIMVVDIKKASNRIIEELIPEGCTGFIVRRGENVACILTAILRTCSPQEMCMLRDELFSRTIDRYES